MKELWEFSDFPCLKLIYRKPKTAQEVYERDIKNQQLMDMLGPDFEFSPEFCQDELPGNFGMEAQLNGLFAGFLTVNRSSDKELYLAQIDVEEPFRNKGIAKRIIFAALQKGRELGFSKAYSLVDADNVASLRLQACCGATFIELLTDDEGKSGYQCNFILDLKERGSPI